MNDNGNPNWRRDNLPKVDRQRALEHYVALAEEASEWRRLGEVNINTAAKRDPIRLGGR